VVPLLREQLGLAVEPVTTGPRLLLLRPPILRGSRRVCPCTPRRPVADLRVGVASGSPASGLGIDRGQEIEGDQPHRRALPAKAEIDRRPSDVVVEDVDRIE